MARERLILYIPPYTFLFGSINMGTSSQKRINSAFLKYHWSMQLQCLPVLNTWKYRKRFLYVPWRCLYSNTGNRCEYKREGMCFHKAKSMWEVFKMVTKLLLQSLIEDSGPTLFLGALYILLWRPYRFGFQSSVRWPRYCLRAGHHYGFWVCWCCARWQRFHDFEGIRFHLSGGFRVC